MSQTKLSRKNARFSISGAPNLYLAFLSIGRLGFMVKLISAGFLAFDWLLRIVTANSAQALQGKNLSTQASHASDSPPATVPRCHGNRTGFGDCRKETGSVVKRTSFIIQIIPPNWNVGRYPINLIQPQPTLGELKFILLFNFFTNRHE